jgi:hypothetical protein
MIPIKYNCVGDVPLSPNEPTEVSLFTVLPQQRFKFRCITLHHDASVLLKARLKVGRRTVKYFNVPGPPAPASVCTGPHAVPPAFPGSEVALIFEKAPLGTRAIYNIVGFMVPLFAPKAPALGGPILSLGDGKYRIGDLPPVIVTDREDNVLQALAEHQVLDEPGLRKRSGIEEAAKVLLALRTKYDGRFASAIQCPGRRGNGGYVADITRVSG